MNTEIKKSLDTLEKEMEKYDIIYEKLKEIWKAINEECNKEASSESNEKTPLIRKEDQRTKSKFKPQRIQEFNTDTNSEDDDYKIERMNRITEFARNSTY